MLGTSLNLSCLESGVSGTINTVASWRRWSGLQTRQQMLFVSRSFNAEKARKRWHLSVPPFLSKQNSMLLIHPSFLWLWQVWGPDGALVSQSVCWLRASTELGTNPVMAILANVGNSSVPWMQNALTKPCVPASLQASFCPRGGESSGGGWRCIAAEAHAVLENRPRWQGVREGALDTELNTCLLLFAVGYCSCCIDWLVGLHPLL